MAAGDRKVWSYVGRKTHAIDRRLAQDHQHLQIQEEEAAVTVVVCWKTATEHEEIVGAHVRSVSDLKNVLLLRYNLYGNLSQ